jgi:hypothetical protein
LSFLVLPGWPVDWLAAIRDAPHYHAPVQRLGGFLLLLAFLRWRQPEARLLGVLALVPHTTGILEQLPLLLIPQTRTRFVGLFASSWLAAVLIYTAPASIPGPHTPAWVELAMQWQWPYHLVLVWLPCLYFVLRQPSAASASRPAAPSVPPRPSTAAAKV